MYERILFPTDGGPASSEALDQVVALSTHFEATVHVLFVVDESTIATDVDTTSLVDQLEMSGDNAIQETTESLRAAGCETVVEAVVRGKPADRILEYADANDIDLIVMGTHGRTGLDRYLLGSVTESVVRNSTTPVLTLRKEESE